MKLSLQSLLYCFLVLFFSKTYGQTYGLSGKVIDIDTKSPISDVYVSVSNSENHSHSDKNGDFGIKELKPGKVVFYFERKGYEIKEVELQLSQTITRLVVELQPKSKEVKEISVVADKPLSAASSMYINQSGFLNRPRNSAQDLLRSVPGLFIAQHAGGGKAEQIFVRGFDCDHGTDVATFVDGLPVNMPSHGHGQGYADLHFVIPETVEGIQVFKGTSSPYFGDFATGAAIQFKTLDTLANNIVSIDGGSYPGLPAYSGTRMLAMAQIPDKTEKVASYFAVEMLNGRGYFERDQKLKRFNLFSKTTFQLSDNQRLQLTFSGFGSTWNASGQIPERLVESGAISRFGYVDPNEGGTTQRNNVNLVHTWKMKKGEWETQAFASTYRFRLYSNFTFFLEDSLHGDMIEQDDQRTVFGIQTKYSIEHHIGENHGRFTVGAMLRSDNIENQLWHAPVRYRLEAKAHANVLLRSQAIYANESFRISKKWRLDVGLRYDYLLFDVEDLLPTDSVHTNYSGYNFQSGLHPKFNLAFSPTNNWQLFLNAGSGFHSNDGRSVVQDKNNHQLPLALSSEIGTLFSVKKMVVSVALWEMEMANELVYVGDDGTTENRGTTRRFGVDFSLRAPITKWLFADADVNWARSRFTVALFQSEKTSDFYVPLAPILTTTGGLSTKFKMRIEASLRYRYMMARPANEDNSVSTRPYTVLDAMIAYKCKDWKWTLSVENLLNTKWNEAQFATTSKLQGETQAVQEIHFTPGTPFFAKLAIAYSF